MIRVLLAAFLLSCSTLSQAQGPTVMPPGEALYSVHCHVCHSAQVHWRDNKLATNWDGLKAQVRRWQGNLKLTWSEKEVEDVTLYLNTLYYRYPPQAGSISLNTPPAAK
jgi:mono/diheme cytochrome c family protein